MSVCNEGETQATSGAMLGGRGLGGHAATQQSWTFGRSFEEHQTADIVLWLECTGSAESLGMQSPAPCASGTVSALGGQTRGHPEVKEVVLSTRSAQETSRRIIMEALIAISRAVAGFCTVNYLKVRLHLGGRLRRRFCSKAFCRVQQRCEGLLPDSPLTRHPLF